MREGRRIFLGGLLTLALPPVLAAPPTAVRYPPSEPQGNVGHEDPAQYFPVRLLRAALEHSGRDYQPQPTTQMMRQNRALVELQSGRAIEVVWTMTSRQREQDLLPVRVPLDRGLIGWRLLLIRKSDEARFAAIRKASELQALEALQGHDWPDTEILRANHYRVQTSSDYAGMFKMLSSGRVDYFPRSVFEVWSEAEAFADQGLMVAPGLALHYPSAFYFFVNKRNTVLAADIQRGLEAMQADGSYERLFQEYFGETLRRSALPSRRVFELRNPLLPEATPMARLDYRF
jgi:hypothetical protein